MNALKAASGWKAWLAHNANELSWIVLVAAAVAFAGFYTLR